MQQGPLQRRTSSPGVPHQGTTGPLNQGVSTTKWNLKATIWKHSVVYYCFIYLLTYLFFSICLLLTYIYSLFYPISIFIIIILVYFIFLVSTHTSNASKITLVFFLRPMDATKREKTKKITLFKLIVLIILAHSYKSHNYMNHYEGTPVHPAITNLAQWAYSETTNKKARMLV